MTLVRLERTNVTLGPALNIGRCAVAVPDRDRDGETVGIRWVSPSRSWVNAVVFKIMSGFAAVSIRIPGIDGAFLKIDEGALIVVMVREDADRVAVRNDRDGFRQRSAYKTDPDHETAPIRRAVAFVRLCAQRVIRSQCHVRTL